MSSEVWLVRHGETEWSLSGQHSGRHDLPLTEFGEREALAAARLVAPVRFDHVRCSTLQRARKTCELAGYAAGAVYDPDLQEWDYGECTGFTQEQIRERMPGWTIWDGPVPGGESIDEIAGRASRAAAGIRKLGGRVLVFAHGHFLRVFATQWLGLPAVTGRHFALETSAVCILGEDSGWPAVLAWNLKD